MHEMGSKEKLFNVKQMIVLATLLNGKVAKKGRLAFIIW
jgi:hypothetical protein